MALMLDFCLADNRGNKLWLLGLYLVSPWLLSQVSGDSLIFGYEGFVSEASAERVIPAF